MKRPIIERASRTEKSALAVLFVLSCLVGALPTQVGAEEGVVLKRINDIPFLKVKKTEIKGDLVRPDDGRTLPGIVVVHGGGFVGGDKGREDMRAMAEWLAREGYVAFNVNYRLLPNGGMFPENVKDVKCAVRWLSAHANEHGVDPERIGAMGESAGGYLVSMLGAAKGPEFLGDCPEGEGGSDRVDAVMSLYGVHDFPSIHTEAAEAVRRLFFNQIKGPREKFERKISPIAYAAQAAPMLMAHGSLDDVVPVEQSRAMRDAMLAAGREAELIEFPGQEHGWFDARHSGPDILATETATLAFFEKHLKKKPQVPKAASD